MGLLIEGRVDGAPGPKGSLNGFCLACAKAGRPQKVVFKEQSEVGVAFRKLVAYAVRKWMRGLAVQPFAGAVEVDAIFYIARRRQVKGGVETDEFTPEHRKPYPTFRNSGDVEKHVRTVHDALMDAGLIEDDSQVVQVFARKRWATSMNPPGVRIKVLAMPGPLGLVND